MKTILVALLIFSINSFGQEVPIKGNTKVIIKNTLSAKENYSLASNTLLSNDYFFESRDSSIFYIKTQPKKVNKWTGLYYLNVRSLNNEIQISGMCKSGIEMNFGGVTSKDDYEPIIFKGMNMSLYKEAFKVMDDFASKFEGIKEYK